MIRTPLLLALFAAPLLAQGTFEGAIAMKVADDRGREMSMNYMMKEGKIRMEQPSGRGGESVGIIIDGSTQKMLMVMTAQKMYMEMDLKASAATAKKAAVEHKVERTGKTEKIAGYTCEHVLVTDDDGAIADACVTSELGAFRMAMGGGPMSQPREPGWASGLGPNTFPLKVTKGDKVILEVTGVEKKTLDAALFVAPPAFNKFEMPSIPGFKKP